MTPNGINKVQSKSDGVCEQTCTEAGRDPSRSLHTHLLAALGGVLPVVQAGFARKPEDFLKQVLGEVLAGGSEDKVAHLSVLLIAMMAEVDEVLDVVVGTKVLQVLTETFGIIRSQDWRPVQGVSLPLV